ncbi:MAG: NAD(P)H-dependent oxidoreductase subunit E [Planctomycetota bacterium]
MLAEEVKQIVKKHGGQRGEVISILAELQARYSHLPAEALEAVAKETGRSLVDVYGVATFYRAFSLKPRGKHLCSVCLGTACHVRGAQSVAAELKRQLGVPAGETTPDREFTLETVNCLGACALGPVVVMDGHYFPQVGPGRVSQIIDKTRLGLDFVDVGTDRRVFPVVVCCPRCNHTLMDPHHLLDGHPSVKVTISFGLHHGWLRLSSLYGSYTIESEHAIPDDEVVHFFCPYCHAELVGASSCPACSAPMVPFIVRDGGIVQICSRRACKGHMLDVGGPAF